MAEDRSLLGRLVALATIAGVIIAALVYWDSKQPKIPQFPRTGETQIAFQNLSGDESPENAQLDAFVGFLRENEDRYVYLHVTLLNSVSLERGSDPLRNVFQSSNYRVFYLAASDSPKCDAQQEGCPSTGIAIDTNADGDKVGYVFADGRFLLGVAIAVEMNDQYADSVGSDEISPRLKGCFYNVGEVAHPAGLVALTVLPYMLRPASGDNCE